LTGLAVGGVPLTLYYYQRQLVSPWLYFQATEENKKRQKEMNDNKKRAANTEAAAAKGDPKKKKAVELDKDIEEDG
jgi:hypothetical protein